MIPETAPSFSCTMSSALTISGSVSRIVFCVPKKMQDRDAVNEVTLTLIVPTDQLAAMVAKLMQAPSASITCRADAGDEVRH